MELYAVRVLFQCEFLLGSMRVELIGSHDCGTFLLHGCGDVRFNHIVNVISSLVEAITNWGMGT